MQFATVATFGGGWSEKFTLHVYDLCSDSNWESCQEVVCPKPQPTTLRRRIQPGTRPETRAIHTLGSGRVCCVGWIHSPELGVELFCAKRNGELVIIELQHSIWTVSSDLYVAHTKETARKSIVYCVFYYS